MRSISKCEYCMERAEKCLRQADSMCYAVIMAPTPMDFELCIRKHRRAMKHYSKYLDLANYYGGK